MLDGLEPFQHPIPYEAMQAEICCALQFAELQSHLLALHPPDLGIFDRERFFLIRQDQANEEIRLFRYGVGTFNRATEDRKIRNLSFADRRGIEEHHRVGDGQAVVLAVIGVWLFHVERSLAWSSSFRLFPVRGE